MPNPRVILLPERPLTKRKRAPRRVILGVTLPDGVGPANPHEAWVERFERTHRGGHPLTHPIMEATVPTGSTIILPRRQREGSITDEQLAAIHAAVNGLTDKRGAVVVCENMDSENSARNKSRALALLHEETYPTIPDPTWTPNPEAKDADGKAIPVGEQTHPQVTNPRRYLTAHAVPDAQNAGKFIGAVSIRVPQESRAEDATKPAAKPAATKPAAPKA